MDARPGKMLTRAEVKELLGVSFDTVDRLRAAGKLVGYRIGTSIRFLETDLHTYLNSVADNAPEPITPKPPPEPERPRRPRPPPFAPRN